MHRHQLVCGALALTTAACGAGWRQLPALSPGPWPSRQQAQVWVGAQAQRWHGVVVERDSISGIPFIQQLDCQHCRRAVPLAAVDSVRVGQPVAGFWKTMGLVVGIPAALLAVLCWNGCFPET
jgi:hypothetical protein